MSLKFIIFASRFNFIKMNVFDKTDDQSDTRIGSGMARKGRMKSNEKPLNRLKVVLVENQKTSKWLAEQLGVSAVTVSKWCTNMHQPDLQTLTKIADALNVDIKDLLNSTKESIK